MGNVYLGVQPQIGSRVAIKILSEECSREPELVERFFAEARAVNLIRHENIVSVIDMARMPDGRPFIVMEFIEGLTLGKVIRSGRAPLGGVVQVFSDVLSALDAAHAIGIVHRDLKPDNILITNKGHAKVLDFGIAKLAPALKSSSGAAPTKTGALLGTPAYMAPEQITGNGVIDGRTDVYGAGIVLFEAVTGRAPFGGATLFDMMRAQLEEAPPSPRALRPDLPESMAAVILTALAKRPEMRFQSVAAMANALEQASLELPQDQWRELSMRSAPLTRGSAPRMRRPTTQPPPRTVHRDTPPAISAVNVPRTDEKQAKPKKSRRGLVLAIGGMCVAAGVGAIIATAATSNETKPAPIAEGSAVASAPPSRGEAPAEKPLVEKPPAEKPLVEKPPIEKPPVEKQQADAKPAIDKKPKPVDKKPPKRVEKEVAVAPPPQQQQSDEPPPVNAAEAQRAKIAKEYGMHKDHVALPGEVPIKRRPRMSRGGYNATNFDYRAFLPHATKLARAELADARLIGFHVSGVAPDGKANIARNDRGAEFRFASANPVEEGCHVIIEVHQKAIETYIQNAAICTAKALALPKCTFAQIWDKARLLGTKSDEARLYYDQNDWTFGGSDLFHTIADDCP
jgi:serine/threonine protein kinase